MKYAIATMAIMAVLFSSSAIAQETDFSASNVNNSVPLTFGTGSETGNYYAIAQDIAAYCGTENVLGHSMRGNKPYRMEVVTSGGSLDNMEGMYAKKYYGGIVQEDVLAYMAKRSPTKFNPNVMKAVFAAHQEVVHVLIPRGYEPESSGGGWLSAVTNVFSGEEPVTMDINLLKNQKVTAWGGSVVSAKAISAFLDLNFDVLSAENAEDAMAKNIPVISVGGIPYKPVQNILDSGNYHLVGLNAQVFAQQAPFYQPVSASYVVDGSLTDVQTIGVRAIVMAKSSRRSGGNDGMVRLSECIEDSVIDLADDPESSPVWQSIATFVASGTLPHWPMFD